MGRGNYGMVVIITGGTRGLGAAIVNYLLNNKNRTTMREMCHVVIIHRGQSVEFVRGLEFSMVDITDVGRVQQAIHLTLDRHGKIDALINNAGLFEPGNVEDSYIANWRRVVDTNLTGAFVMTQQVLPIMRENNYGRIVNIGSFGGLLGLPGSAAYNASKAGLVGLTKSTANENAKYGITCNMVVPGCVDAGIFRRFDSDHRQRLLKRVPMKRAACPDEIAAPVSWLLSHEASYITGQVLSVDGGIT